MSRFVGVKLRCLEGTMQIPIDKIRVDGGTQPRARTDGETIDRYANAMRDGAKFPAVVVFFDGTDYWPADGFHRIEAAKQESWTKIEADVRQGTKRDAKLHAFGCNVEHGLPRTNADKRRCVEEMLRDEEWSRWSDRKVAEACGVSQPFVSGIRKTVTANVISEPRRYVTKHGTESVMSTSKIGRRAADAEPEETMKRNVEPVRDGIVRVRHEERPAHPAKKVDDHELVRTLTEEGLTVSDIASKTGLKKMFIHHARSKILPKKSVLAGAIEDAELFAESWQSRAKSLPPAWSVASRDEIEALVQALDACRVAAKRVIQRLKKEAEQGDVTS